ncbi:hypothetical protein [Glycomyces buryatensis]|uniref:WD40 repeat domain-containing protein n=1 Tax=Glycomyces buryatensis TaxID=2570927 RepID=A0A4S8QA28_9ACTN|nr:hypothetical protein [Glycomyces buryatensis]THV41188.1 hypothetical protein FAB82_13140 [Glycomyces buryatensis]
MAMNPSRRMPAAVAIGAAALLAVAGCWGDSGAGEATDPPESESPQVIHVPPSQAAVTDLDGRSLIAIRDGRAHPLDGVEVPESGRVAWSPDGTLMAVDVRGGFWEWEGPGEDPLDHECGQGCDAAYVGDDPDDLYSYRDNAFQRVDGDAGPEITADLPEEHSVLWGAIGGHLLVGTANDGARFEDEDYLGTEQLWLIDPADGEPKGSVDLSNQPDGYTNRVTASADGSQVAVEYTGASLNRCGYTSGFSLVDGADLGSARALPPPPNEVGAEPIAWDVFFNGGSLFGVFGEPSGPASNPCQSYEAMGVWRWGEAGWKQVSAGDFYAVRPLEGLDGGGSEAALIQDHDFNCRVVDLPGGEVRADLGRCDVGVWSTPTRNEVDLSGIESY